MSNKYNAKPGYLDGIYFDSQAERQRYLELKLLAREKQIIALKVHPRYELFPADKDRHLPRMVYEGDFEYFDQVTKTRVVEDVKGVETPVFRLKANIFRRLYPELELRVLHNGRRVLLEE